jgi:hypothetical protein
MKEQLEKQLTDHLDTEKENEDEDFEKDVKNKSKKELIALCTEMNFPVDEWETLTANDLKSYIINKAKG